MKKQSVHTAIQKGHLPVARSADPIASESFEEFLSLNWRTGELRNGHKAVETISKALEPSGVIYGIGITALGLYLASPECTLKLNYIFLMKDRVHVLDALKNAGFCPKKGANEKLYHIEENDSFIGVELFFGESDPEESAVFLTKTATLFGVQTRVLTPEMLLWILLRCRKSGNREDLYTVADMEALEMYLHWAEDSQAIEALKALKAYIAKPKETWSDLERKKKEMMKGKPPKPSVYLLMKNYAQKVDTSDLTC